MSDRQIDKNKTIIGRKRRSSSTEDERQASGNRKPSTGQERRVPKKEEYERQTSGCKKTRPGEERRALNKEEEHQAHGQ